MLDRQKAQKFRLLWKGGETDEALSFAASLFNDCLGEDDPRGAAQALIFMSHIFAPIGESEVLKRGIQKLKSASIKKGDITPYVWFLRGYIEILLEQGRLKEASRLVKEIEDMEWRDVALVSKARLALVRGEPEYSLELLEGLKLTDPTAMLLKAEALAGTGRFRETVELITNSPKDTPPIEAVKNDILGFCYICMGEYERAKRHINQALEEVRKAHGAAMELSTCLASLGIVFATEGDIDRANLYLELGENSAARVGRLKTTLEIKAIKESVLPQNGDSLMRIEEIEAEARTRGFGVAMLWAKWAKIAVKNKLGLESDSLEDIKTLMNLTKEHELWGYISYIAHAVPTPFMLALSVFPDKMELREIAEKLSPRSKQARMKLLVMGQPAIETPRGRFHLEKGRPGEVLVFFALHAKGELTRERIIQEFWPRLPLERARRNYYKFTALARAILRNQGVAIKPHKSHTSAWIGCEIRTDLDELRNLVNTAKAVEASAPTSEARPIYEKALSLIRGDFLEGWRPGFLEDIRDEVRELTSLVYTRMAEYSLDEEPEQALRFAERALSIRPFSEDACEMAMKALIRLKMPERAKKLYEDFTEQFKNELKMESRLGWPPRFQGK
ncbi:MAG: BTAD domain-containing putative transcriptional regulator [candidate division WOR-3 bacterium]